MLLDIEKKTAPPVPISWSDYLDCDIFLTQTVSPSLYHKTSREIYKQTKQKFQQILQNHCGKYICVMELTKQAIPHFHVILKWKDELDPIMYHDSIKSIKGQPLGHSIIKDVTDLVELCAYLEKDLKNQKTHRIINTAGKTVMPVYFGSKDTQHKIRFNKLVYEGNIDNNIDDCNDAEDIDLLNNINKIFLVSKK